MASGSFLDVIKDFLSILALVCGAVFATGGAWALIRRGLHDVDKTKKELEELRDRHQQLAKELRERCCAAEVLCSRLEAIQQQDGKVIRVLLDKTMPLLPDNNSVCKLSK